MGTISDFCYEIALDYLRDEINRNRESTVSIEVYRIPSYGTGVIELGINWSCRGTVSVDEAQAFATDLTRATRLVRSHPMNGMKLVRPAR